MVNQIGINKHQTGIKDSKLEKAGYRFETLIPVFFCFILDVRMVKLNVITVYHIHKMLFYEYKMIMKRFLRKNIL